MHTVYEGGELLRAESISSGEMSGPHAVFIPGFYWNKIHIELCVRPHAKHRGPRCPACYVPNATFHYNLIYQPNASVYIRYTTNINITTHKQRSKAPVPHLAIFSHLFVFHLQVLSHPSLIHIMDQSVTCLMVHFILVLKLIFSSSPFLHRSVSSFTRWSAGTFNCPLCGRIWRFKCRQVRQIKPAQLAFGRTIK